MLAGDFNTPSIKWNRDSEFNHDLSPSAIALNSDLLFINRVIDKGFRQCNDNPNNLGIFLDLLFYNFDMSISARLPSSNEWLDNGTYHHSAHVFSIDAP